MTAQIIDGKAIAQTVRDRIKSGVEALQEKSGITPGLATVLVGDNPASHTYIRMKRKACAEVGIESLHHELSADATQEEVENLVRSLNENNDVHGILVQLPLPKNLNDQRILDLVSYEKDVDGFHPMNTGLLAVRGREPRFSPCTPSGVMVMLEEAGVEVEGKEAVVLGRSNVVGTPMALLLRDADATVTIAHSRTKDLPSIARRADILVAAVGRPEMVKADWVKDGAVVIDVGVNRVEDASKKRGYRLVGDVAFDEVAEKASAITPVPGGVGPMTIAILLRNTLRSAEERA